MYWENPYRRAIGVLDQEISFFKAAHRPKVPERGWIFTFRTTLGMTLRQLGKRMSMSPQGIYDMEKGEIKGAVTIQQMKEVAGEKTSKCLGNCKAGFCHES
jgi:hypothetical protein